MEYVNGYGKHSHFVRRIRVGIPVSHDHLSLQPICWRFLRIPLTRISHAIASEALSKFQESCLKLKTRWEDDALDDMDKALVKMLGDLVSHFKRNCEEKKSEKKRIRKGRKKPRKQEPHQDDGDVEEKKKKKKKSVDEKIDDDEVVESSEDGENIDLTECVDEVHSECIFSDADSESESDENEDDLDDRVDGVDFTEE
jgi:hypothetical protein